jgi:hypothetical protein
MRYSEFKALIEITIRLFIRSGRTLNILLVLLLVSIASMILLYTQNELIETDFLYSPKLFFFINLFIYSILPSQAYAIYGLGWYSAYFNLLMSQNINIKSIIIAHYFVVVILLVFPVMVNLGFILFLNKPHLFYSVWSNFIYNVGLFPFISLVIAARRFKPININEKGLLSNWQGNSAKDPIEIILFFLIPVLCFGLLYLLKSLPLLYPLLMGIGLISILLYKIWFRIIVLRFTQNKYKIINGFEN